MHEKYECHFHRHACGRAWRWLALSATVAVLCGCVGVGTGSVGRDRMDYGGAMLSSWKEQTLLNIVRLRYADSPLFLDVSSVITSYSFESQLNLGVTVVPNSTGDTGTLGASGKYTDRPTITYTPVTGDKFTKGLLRPISPSTIMSLIHAGYPADFLLQLTTRAINGIYNRSAAPARARDADPEFYKVLDALRRIQASESISIRLEKRGPDEVSVMIFGNKKTDDQTARDIRFARETLGLKSDARELQVTFGSTARSNTEFALLSRSMLEILIEFSAGIEVPDRHVQEGRTYGVRSAPPDVHPRDLPLVRIHSSPERPADAFTAVAYRDHWFWIDDRDFASKRTMTFLMMLFSLAETGVTPQIPVITVPAG